MDKILFECHHLYYLPNFIPIIKVLQIRGGFDIHISIPQTMSEFEKNGVKEAAGSLGIKYIYDDSEEQRLEKLRKTEYNCIIVGNIGKLHSIAVENTITVMVYHGIGLKQTYYRDISDRIDIRVVESQDRFDILQKKGFQNIHLVGFTKLDPLFNGEYDKNAVINDCQLDPDKKTILYAPSFYPTSIDKVLPELEILSSFYNVIVKLHQFGWHQKRYRYQSELVQQYATRSRSIYLVPREKFDILPYFAASDILISDISSALFEYLPLNRPILLNEFYTLRLKHKIFYKRFSKKLDLDRLDSIDVVRWVKTVDELGLLVTDAIENSDDLSQKRTDAIHKYLYRSDGKASSRLVDMISEKIKNGRV